MNQKKNPYWLLLRRSAEHPFYRRGGHAEIPGYGTGRCAIGNIEELCDALRKAGMPVRIYEPGVHSLQDQIRTFYGARGIVGIRGAEFANLLWMRPGSRAIMIKTPLARENHAAHHLALVRGIDFATFAVDSFYPTVAAEEVLQAMR